MTELLRKCCGSQKVGPKCHVCQRKCVLFWTDQRDMNIHHRYVSQSPLSVSMFFCCCCSNLQYNIKIYFLSTHVTLSFSTVFFIYALKGFGHTKMYILSSFKPHVFPNLSFIFRTNERSLICFVHPLRIQNGQASHSTERRCKSNLYEFSGFNPFLLKRHDIYIQYDLIRFN